MKEFVTFMFSPEMRGQLRHIVSGIGYVLAANGISNQGYIEAIIGVAFVGLSMWDSWKTKKQ